MQDGYYFATSPWLIGDPQPAVTALGVDHLVLRQGQVVQIAADDDAPEKAPISVTAPPITATGSDDDICSDEPVQLRLADRRDATPIHLKTGDEPGQSADLTTVLIADLARQQMQALDRINQTHRESVAGLEDRIVAGLAALVELVPSQAVQAERLDTALTRISQVGAGQGEALVEFAKAFDRLAAKVDTGPKQNDQMLRELADLRAGLTELRVQARMIELQLFSLGRGTENPPARPLMSASFAAKEEVFAS
jgi:hypothetical protein